MSYMRFPSVFGHFLNDRSERFLLEIDLFADADDLHSGLGVGPARDDGFFFVATCYPNLTFEAVAVPAEFAFRNGFHAQILKASEDRIVFGHMSLFAANGDIDQLLERLKNFRVGHFGDGVLSELGGFA